MIDVPDPVARKARLAGAGAWLDALPDLVADVARDWGLTLGRTFTAATEAFVAEATMADGTAGVLKIPVPRAEAQHELTVLRLADGDGCARLLAADPDRGAFVLERLGPSLHDLGVPVGLRLEILCDLARRVWRPAADAGLPTGADKAQWLIEFVEHTWEDLGRPCSEAAVAHALACATRRRAAYDPSAARLVHGDVHQWNALRSPDGYALVDPDGLLAEPEYDLGVIMREDPVELLRDGPTRRAEWLAARTGTSAVAIWEWGVVERVSTGLVLASVGLHAVAREMLHAADVIAAAAD
jgi:streptomycin 6-kinase